MHLGIEGPRGRGIAQVRDCFGVASLPRERDPEIERRIRFHRPAIEHETKRPLGISEVFPLEVLPARGEALVDRRDGRRRRMTTGCARKRSPRE